MHAMSLTANGFGKRKILNTMLNAKKIQYKPIIKYRPPEKV